MKTATSPADHGTTYRLTRAGARSSTTKAFAILASAAITFSFGVSLTTIATAQEPAAQRTIATGSNIPLAADAPDRYTVKRGDTLWDIAKVFLRDPWYWPEIWYVNPQVKNPHLIYPGDVLSLVSQDGQLHVVMTERGPEGVAAESAADETVRRGSGTRLSPSVRSEPITGAITAVSYESIAAFMGKPSLLSNEEVKSGPYIVGVRDLHLMAGEGTNVYARGIRNAQQGTRYNIIHVDSPLRDPENNKVLGYRAMYAGVGAVTAVGDPATLMAQNTQREILRGDKLFAEEVTVNLDFMPHPAPANIHGSIAAVEGVFIAGKYQTVALNRGNKQGVEVGHVFEIQQKGETVVDRYKNGGQSSTWSVGKRVKLPNERAGIVMVFRTYDRMSYGLIMEATHPVRIGDRIVAP